MGLDQNATKSCRLFVYGSLKRGYYNSGYLANQSFLGEIYTAEGYTLYDLGVFPAMVRGEGRVKGHLFDVSYYTLYITDRLEGHPFSYKRTKIRLCDDTESEAYIWQHSTKHLVHLGEEWYGIQH